MINEQIFYSSKCKESSSRCKYNYQWKMNWHSFDCKLYLLPNRILPINQKRMLENLSTDVQFIKFAYNYVFNFIDNLQIDANDQQKQKHVRCFSLWEKWFRNMDKCS
jgi:hypothetical protein